jgi:SPP1 gp7 family putative phage head morphogenesis protein
MCGICDVENKYKEPLSLFTDEEIENIILAIYFGIINVRNLDVGTYRKVARKLSEGVFKGFGKTLFDVQYESADWLMIKALETNVYIFSGVKQYQQVRAMSALLVGEGRVRSFNEFKKPARDIFNEYNENYLHAEYNSAIAQARTASQWQEIIAQSQTFPMLTYHTVGDARVRPTHAALDDIARPVGDKFWDSYMPPNGWNCRCTVLQDEDAVKTSLRGFRQPNDVPDIFMFNAGKEKIVFSPKHPYFDVAKRDKNWAQRNFGLPLP